MLDAGHVYEYKVLLGPILSLVWRVAASAGFLEANTVSTWIMTQVPEVICDYTGHC